MAMIPVGMYDKDACLGCIMARIPVWDVRKGYLLEMYHDKDTCFGMYHGKDTCLSVSEELKM